MYRFARFSPQVMCPAKVSYKEALALYELTEGNWIMWSNSQSRIRATRKDFITQVNGSVIEPFSDNDT